MPSASLRVSPAASMMAMLARDTDGTSYLRSSTSRMASALAIILLRRVTIALGL